MSIKFTELPVLAGVDLADDDIFAVVDVSVGVSKSVTLADLAITTTAWEYISAPQTITLGTTLSVAHGLTPGANGLEFEVVMRCATAEFGYAVGDEMVLVSAYSNPTPFGAIASVSSTHVAIRTSNIVLLGFATNGTANNPTVANWRWIVRVRVNK
jgi:hypothetical protein